MSTRYNLDKQVSKLQVVKIILQQNKMCQSTFSADTKNKLIKDPCAKELNECLT